jgi:zinc-ribbon domain
MTQTVLVYCTKCGHKVATTAPRCPACGAPPYQGGVSKPSNQPTQIVVGGPQRLPAATWQDPQPRPQVIVIAYRKSAGLAAVLSAFWPGIGQIYNGDLLKGFANCIELAVVHVGNLKEAIRVCTGGGPVCVKYSLAYQNVQSSTGSILMLVCSRPNGGRCHPRCRCRRRS